MSNKVMEKFTHWRNGLTLRQRKHIKTGIDILIGLLLLGGFLNVYEIGVHNGKVEMCQSQDQMLVQFQGLEECWNREQYEAYMEQWKNPLEDYNDLQYVNS